MLEKLSGKRLLVLGGVIQMVEVVKLAKTYGIEVLVTDYLENSPAKKYADKSFMVSATDVDGVVELCKSEKVDGIVTGYVDLLLPYYAQICEKAGLPCYGSFEIFNIMTDKKLFKKLYRDNNVPTIKEWTTKEVENNQGIEYPVIVKPTDSSGSRGISVCNNYSELLNGIEKALQFSPSKQYIVEKYMTGKEVVLYYYFQDGNPIFMGMCDRYVCKEQAGVAQLPIAYVFPSKYTDSHLRNTDCAIKQMFKNIGVKNGTMFLQAFIEDDIVYVYEPGYRLNGAREQYVFGPINDAYATKMLIHFALTGKMHTESLSQKCDPYICGKHACVLSPVLKTGRVDKIIGLDYMKSNPCIFNIAITNDVNSVVSNKEIGTLRQLAYRNAIIADTKEELINVINDVQRNVDWLDEEGNSLMLRQFSTDELE